ncbi:hypothetical protein ER308_07125 [Egibacter rhizosphaerae]|uniref:Uncharacterized protein n=1 Tax=Egibacter rhizosphaerae TaxID=1670831 RepID=A0A411YDR0_9ACTN|nr:hypothetical protein [Egibacter rhizosphaerae]QBI19338.1 hypothetical protein ER308_07125 [Egibacter rhizosphaerae]
MPRRGRGPDPSQTGRPSAQRTDRNQADAPAQAPDVPAGSTTWGERQQLEQQQQQMPAPDERQRFQQVLQRAQQADASPVMMNRPSDRPGEDVREGLGTGGQGLEGMQQMRPGQREGLVEIARRLPLWEQHAARPGTSNVFKQFVRIMRSRMPADVDMSELLGGEGGGASR